MAAELISLTERTIKAFNAYADEVEKGRYPDNRHSYNMKSDEYERLQKLLKDSL